MSQQLRPEAQRRFALDVLRKLRDAGFEAYWAGGCVRDQLLGRAPNDYDVATSARPDEIRRLFGRRRTLAIGAAFGVIVVLGPREAGQVEVTTFRTDASYSDGRHPDHVTFGTAEEDVRRRDFTINGMLYDPVEQRVLDYVGGQADLEQGCIRAIGDPLERFAEDKLRVLRAARFAARFDFVLDEGTKTAVQQMASQVTVVSAERIAQEIRAMLVHESRAAAVELCRELDLLAAVLPEVLPLCDAAGGGATGWDQTLAVLAGLRSPSFPLALAALLHLAGPAQSAARTTEQVGRRWRLSNKEIEQARWLVCHQSALQGAVSMPWSQLQPLLVAEGIADLIQLHEARALAAGQSAGDCEFCRQKLQLPADELNPPPLITGDDLIAHGVPQGKIYAQLLQAVRQGQLDGELHSRDGALARVDALRARAPEENA